MDLNRRFTITCPKRLIMGCPCALSQAGCLGLLTVEKRMLWLECCGVNSGGNSSQQGAIAGVPLQIKWRLPVTCLHTPRFHIDSKHKNWRHIKRVHGPSHLLMNVSHSLLAGLAADRSVSVVPHQSRPRSQSLWGRETLDRRCFPGGLSQLACRHPAKSHAGRRRSQRPLRFCLYANS